MSSHVIYGGWLWPFQFHPLAQPDTTRHDRSNMLSDDTIWQRLSFSLRYNLYIDIMKLDTDVLVMASAMPPRGAWSLWSVLLEQLSIYSPHVPSKQGRDEESDMVSLGHMIGHQRGQQG